VITPTDDQLRSAWASMRLRMSLRLWPDSFDQVMADPRRAALVSMEARAAARSANRLPLPCQVANRIERTAAPAPRPQAQHAALPTVHTFDRKRAAAGDRDD
jgi:hypothetical protein